MVALKAKTLSLPHLSLSRTSSPSRSSSLNSTSSTPTSTAPTSPATMNPPVLAGGNSASTTPTTTTPSTGGGTFSFSKPLALDRKKSKSSSPKFRPTESPPSMVEPLTATNAVVPEGSVPSATLPPPASDKDKDKFRRSSFGASLSAFANAGRPASSATKSPSTPAGLTLTPASAQRATSENSASGLKPLRAVMARSGTSKASATSDDGGAIPARSKSSDRAEGIAAAAAFANGSMPPPQKKKGMMGAVRGLALGHSASQPAQSRSAAGTTGPTTHQAAHAGGLNSPFPPTLSGAATPSTATPSNGHGHAPQLHQLAESYVSKVSLRLGETVNRVFMPSPTGSAGQQADKLEGAFFVAASAMQDTTGGKGRPCPRVIKSREFGETVFSELQAALHDPYLLRTILRSSVLKSLSLFLSRLSALLLVPTSASDAAFAVPLALSVCKDPKAQESDAHFASNFPVALRYNLHIVRCASTVKQYLLRVAEPANGFPSFVEETLRPWRVKLAELIARVMGPVVTSYRNAINEACSRSRLEGGLRDVDGSATGPEGRGRANSGDRRAAEAGHGLAAPVATKVSATSQLRSLSLSRSSTPNPLSSGPGLHGAGHGGLSAGPAWLREATALLDLCAKLIARLDAKTDADRWVVSIASAAVWKGMLGCSARIITEDGTIPSSTTSAVNASSTNVHAQPVAPTPIAPTTKNRLLGGVKKTPSPPASPPLPAIDLAGPTATGSSVSPSTVAFVRLISDLELFEHRIVAFLSATISSPQVVLHPSAAPVDPCPGAPSCGLCKTGRTFDEESDSSDEELNEAKAGPPAGRESRLALSAMREAMQALSALIIVVRASKDFVVVRDALKFERDGADKVKQDPNAPLTPSDLFALGPAPAPTPTPTSPSISSPSPAAAPTTSAGPSASITIVSPSPAHPRCPTLHTALLEMPPLVLLHLVLSRLPPSLSVKLPHELWGLRGGWIEYETELRGFAQGEEWAGEVAWEVKNELARVKQLKDGAEWTDVEQVAIDVLERTVDKVAREAA